MSSSEDISAKTRSVIELKKLQLLELQRCLRRLSFYASDSILCLPYDDLYPFVVCLTFSVCSLVFPTSYKEEL